MRIVVGASMALAMKRLASTAPPSARRTAVARPLRTTTSLTSAPVMTEPPHTSITRASASVKLAEPPTGSVNSMTLAKMSGKTIPAPGTLSVVMTCMYEVNSVRMRSSSKCLRTTLNSDGEHLLLAAAERGTGMIDALGELRKFLEHLVEVPALIRSALFRRSLQAGEHAGRQQQVLAHAERAENPPALRHDRNAILRNRVGRLSAQRAPAIDDIAGAWRRKPGNRTDQCRLAHAVAAEDGRDAPLAQGEADALQDVAVPIVGVNLGNREQGFRHGRNTRRGPRDWPARPRAYLLPSPARGS